MALPDRFAASLAVHKVGFIQLIKPRVGGQHFGQMFRHILLVGFHTQTAPAELFIDFVQQSRDFCKQPVTGFLRRLLPYPGIPVGVGLQLRSIDVKMRQIHLLLRKDGQIDILKNRFYALRQHLVDEVTEGAIGRRFPVHQVHVAHVDLAIVFQFPQRAVSIVRKGEQHRFQHVDRIVPVSSRDVFRNVLQVLA